MVIFEEYPVFPYMTLVNLKKKNLVGSEAVNPRILTVVLSHLLKAKLKRISVLQACTFLLNVLIYV